jgi:hypothetical protein
MARFQLSRRSGRCCALVFGILTVLGLVTVLPGPRMAALGQAPQKPRGPEVRSPGGFGKVVDPFPLPPELVGVELLKQTKEQAEAKSGGCVVCHQTAHDPHYKDTLNIGCCDCHGGDPTADTKEKAHPPARFPDAWYSSANPVRSYTLLNYESPEYIRFVNPGDLRIAHISCGTTGCHAQYVLENRKSIMTHGCMLLGAAIYNNGFVPVKRSAFGEAYSMNGVPVRLQTVPAPSEEEQNKHGVVPYLDPLPRYENSQPANVFRIFERGGRFRNETGIPERDEDPGRPRTRLSVRGLGTETRTDPTAIGAQKTRLFDPTLNFLGTNDQPGDYRSSGCTACHVIYANDRWAVTAGPYHTFGNRAKTVNTDPTIPKDEIGHPIEHRFTRAIPTSQCIVCHVHPGTTVMNSYTGFMWWDEETDGELIYPAKPLKLTNEQFNQVQFRNPNESATKSLMSDPEFVANMWDLNDKTKHYQFADYHGHGWAFRSVFKHDRKGNLLDWQGKVLPEVENAKLRAAMEPPTPEERQHGKKRDGVPVHLMDIHLEKGMHCIDCHFIQDCHGNTRLQMEVRAAIEIQCVDCHGTTRQRATLRTTGPAAYTSGSDGKGRDLEKLRTPFNERRFVRQGDKIIQNSMVEKGLSWEVVQTVDVITPGHPHYNEKAHLAKTVRFGANGKMVWGDLPGPGEPPCAHQNENMTCITCHSSWNPSCYGCHLPQKANKKGPQLHNEGLVTRNYVSYNFQTLRDDVYMLARDGDVTGNRINPARSSCAIHAGSYNVNRESIYVQQQTISGEGFSGIAFSTNVPHTVRGAGLGETKMCTDCHVSKADDNNAIMAQLLMHGTGFLNFMGKYCWVACGEHGFYGVQVTEREEPQAVIGSYLHKLAFPDKFEEHEHEHKELKTAHEHPGRDISEQLLHPFSKPDIHMVQVRGEYLFAACGHDGMRVFDVAFIDDKGFSERTTTAPVSPLGQRFYVRTRDARCVAAPCTPEPDPYRTHMPANKEQPVHPLFGYVYIADKVEGMITVPIHTTIDGNPLNNFLRREVTFNPDGILNGAEWITIVGSYAYVCCEEGLVVVSIDDPKCPKVVTVVHEELHHPKKVACQFRYAYVIDEEGVKVLDITNLAHPHPISKLEIHDLHSIYLARTYAYLAAGPQGLVILDIEHPERPKVDQVFTADGCINDLHDVQLGITYNSEFAYLADGKNGMRVVQLTGPETPGNNGFSPRPTPELIATFKIPHHGEAKAITRALDRDRAVDECGNQIGVFGRVGARPLNVKEQHKFYLRNGQVWKVSDDPKDPMYQGGKRSK